jgi:hypothetical protein
MFLSIFLNCICSVFLASYADIFLKTTGFVLTSDSLVNLQKNTSDRRLASLIINQKFLADHHKIKIEVLQRLKTDLPFTIVVVEKLLHECLNEQLSDCDLKRLQPFLELVCILEIKSYIYQRFKFHSDSSQNFCWIIYAIHFLEQCRSRLNTDRMNCLPQYIDLVIKGVQDKMEKIRSSKKSSILDYYVNLFYARSMQVYAIYDE